MLFLVLGSLLLLISLCRFLIGSELFISSELFLWVIISVFLLVFFIVCRWLIIVFIRLLMVIRFWILLYLFIISVIDCCFLWKIFSSFIVWVDLEMYSGLCRVWNSVLLLCVMCVVSDFSFSMLIMFMLLLWYIGYCENLCLVMMFRLCFSLVWVLS